MSNETVQYTSYLVRLWLANGADGLGTADGVFRRYHAEVEHIQTGQRHQFYTPADLWTFLHRHFPTGEQNETSDD